MPSGRVTAVVARAGMGKSTLLNLVARVRDPQEGTIRIGGDDVREVTLGSLRDRVVKVSQFPLLLADTMRANQTAALEAQAEAATEKMLLPVVTLVVGMILFIGFGVVQAISTPGTTP